MRRAWRPAASSSATAAGASCWATGRRSSATSRATASMSRRELGEPARGLRGVEAEQLQRRAGDGRGVVVERDHRDLDVVSARRRRRRRRARQGAACVVGFRAVAVDRGCTARPFAALRSSCEPRRRATSRSTGLGQRAACSSSSRRVRSQRRRIGRGRAVARGAPPGAPPRPSAVNPRAAASAAAVPPAAALRAATLSAASGCATSRSRASMNGATPSTSEALGDRLLEPERVRVAARWKARVGQQQAGDGPGAHQNSS